MHGAHPREHPCCCCLLMLQRCTITTREVFDHTLLTTKARNRDLVSFESHVPSFPTFRAHSVCLWPDVHCAPRTGLHHCKDRGCNYAATPSIPQAPMSRRDQAGFESGCTGKAQTTARTRCHQGLISRSSSAPIYRRNCQRTGCTTLLLCSWPHNT